MAESKKKKVQLPVIPLDDPSLDSDDQGPNKKLNCQGCELYSKRRVAGCGAVVRAGDASDRIDIMMVGESPSSWSANNQQVFYGRGGRIIRNTWRELKELDAKRGNTLRMNQLKRWDTYAVQCQVEEGRDQNATASAATVTQCARNLRRALLDKRPRIVLAFGAVALRALGYKSDKFMEARGRLLDVDIDGVTYKVLPTFSTKHVTAKTGLYNLFYADYVRAVRIAAGVDEVASNTTLEEITKEYRIPKTVAEVKQLVDDVIEYVVEGAKTAAQCALALDVETNTLYPQRRDAKVLCLSLAWDVGRAGAISLYHRETPWSPSEMEEVVGHVQRLLACAKPKVFHNAKFDLKFLELRHGWRVNNVQWDSLLGEHLLREDMTGSYGLKTLGRSYFPAFGNYADKVQEIAEQLTPEEEGQRAALIGVKKGAPKRDHARPGDNRRAVLTGIKTGKPKKGSLGIEEGLVLEMTKGEVEREIYGVAPDEDMVGIEEGLVFELSKSEVEREVFGTKKDRKKRVMDAGYERVPLDTLNIYAAVDTDLTRRLLRHQFARAQNEGFHGNARALMSSHCVPASRALGSMEFTGFRVDRPYLDKLEVDLGKIVDEKKQLLDKQWEGVRYEKQIVDFNPNSTGHIGHLLFQVGVLMDDGKRYNRYGPWAEINKKSGKHKTDKKTLKAIAEKMKCPFAKTLLEYRAAHKALTGFVRDIKILSEYDGYLHTNFHLHGTSTGRLSSSNVNMQNQPKKLAGVNIKKIFIPDDPEEEVIFNVDWKGAEIRVFTAYAPDAQLIKALNDGLDVHSWFTQEIFGIPYDEVEAKKDIDFEMGQTRTTVKRVVFGILYGAMAKKIAETAGISEERAQEVIDKLFDRFPSLKNYMDEVVSQIHTKGFVETLFGRRRRFPLQSVNGFFRGQAERRGKNMKIQSTSSDIVVSQLIEIFEHIAELGGRLCITVHDSIVGTIKKKFLPQATAFFDYYCVKRVREKCPWLPVDFAYDVAVGPSYGETIALADWLKKNPPVQQTQEQEFFELLDQDALADYHLDEDGKPASSPFDPADDEEDGDEEPLAS